LNCVDDEQPLYVLLDPPVAVVHVEHVTEPPLVNPVVEPSCTLLHVPAMQPM
jgi:hypothetical protein